jgi:RIP metalloprotease RseP
VPGKLILAASGAGLLGTGFDVTGPESVLQAISLLALIVAVHEAGHFMAARLQNIHVTKFSIGFGPTLVKYQGAEVEYSLRAFPLGGFVAFPDDDPDSKFEEDDPDLLRNRPLLDRAIVISAGVAANFVFAYTILFTQVRNQV